MPLDVRHLRTFVAVADTQHFGRAAERLGIAQSALSSQLRRLEDVVGGRLLERGRRSAVQLTRSGRVFLVEAQRAVDDFDRVERLGRLAVRGRAGEVRMGYVFSAAMTGVLANVLGETSRAMPEIRIKASLMETPDQVSALVNAELELGLFRPRESYPAEIATRVVHRESFLLALASSHPFAKMATLDLQTLMTETFIVPSTGGRVGMEAAVADLSRHLGTNLPPMLATADFVTAISMAASGQGLVLCPKSVSRLQIPGVCYRDIAGFAATASLVLGWRLPASEFIEAATSLFPMLPPGSPD